MDVKAPRVADGCLPGQFIIVTIDEEGERIPLTICDYDRAEGTITIVFQTVGASTERMAELNEGDALMILLDHLVSHLSFVLKKTWRRQRKRISYLSPAVSVLHRSIPRLSGFKEHGVDTTVIIGARSKDSFSLRMR